jgi:hypothetical protein
MLARMVETPELPLVPAELVEVHLEQIRAQAMVVLVERGVLYPRVVAALQDMVETVEVEAGAGLRLVHLVQETELREVEGETLVVVVLV